MLPNECIYKPSKHLAYICSSIIARILLLQPHPTTSRLLNLFVMMSRKLRLLVHLCFSAPCAPFCVRTLLLAATCNFAARRADVIVVQVACLGHIS